MHTVYSYRQNPTAQHDVTADGLNTKLFPQADHSLEGSLLEALIQ
jgi:hypothetical protein